MGKLKIYDSTTGQFVEINTFPQKSSLVFTTVSISAAGASVSASQPNFNNRSLVRKVKVTPTDSGVDSYQIDFYKDSSFSEAKLEYRATANGVFIDNDVWFHEDEENARELHWKITNNSATASTFTIEILAEVFA